MTNRLHCTPQPIIWNDLKAFQQIVDKRQPSARRPQICKHKPTVYLAFFLSLLHGQSDKFKKLYPAHYVRQEEISQNQEKDTYIWTNIWSCFRRRSGLPWCVWKSSHKQTYTGDICTFPATQEWRMWTKVRSNDERNIEMAEAGVGTCSQTTQTNAAFESKSFNVLRETPETDKSIYLPTRNRRKSLIPE